MFTARVYLLIFPEPCTYLTIYTYITDNPQKWEKDLKRQFTKEDEQMAKKHMKRCPTSPVVRKMEIKTTMRHYSTPIRMAKVKNKKTITSIDNDVE